MYQTRTTTTWLITIALTLGSLFAARGQAADSQPGPIRIACIGDSITFGAGIKNRDQNSYPAQLQKALGDRYKVRNFGCSGADVLMINNGPYAKTREHQAALAFQPQLVICNLGINDYALLADHQRAFVRDYTQLLRQYASLPSKPQLMIWTDLAPVMPGQRNYEQCLNLQDTYAKLLRRVAASADAIGLDMQTPLAGHTEWFPDHLHPNAQGARVIAQTVGAAIKQHAPAKLVSAVVAAETSDNSFEGAAAGGLSRLVTPGGTWSAEPGHAVVHADHAKTGGQSLRLLGGENRAIHFSADSDGKQAELLTFWAERWTARGPFRFRVEQQVDGRWTPIYSGGDAIRVGGFLTQVKIPLKETKEIALRMVATTPESSGVMIDDFEIVESKPMVINSATNDQPALPALVGAPYSAISRVNVRVDGNSGPPPVVEEIEFSIAGTTDLADVVEVQVFYTGAEGLVSATRNPNALASAKALGEPKTPADRLELKGEQSLSPGDNYFWIAFRVSPDANIDHRLNAVTSGVRLAGGQVLKVATPEPLEGQRMGVALRRRGDDGVHTYRIPGLATTNRGTLIGVYDIRHRDGGDLPGDIDVGMSRSTDGGRTWEPMQAIMDMGDDPTWRYEGIGDPAVLVDRQTNTIWVAAVWSHGNRGWVGSQPGMTPEETGQLMLARSDDDGRTWSKPINITQQVKKPEWSFLLQGPGRGITMQDGTLVFAAQYQDTPANRRLPRSTIIYSRDRGETWQIGAGAFDDTTEAQVVELEPGRLMLNCRYNRAPQRVVVTSDDMGKTWQEHPSSRKALIEPRACMASLIAVHSTSERATPQWLLFSNPNNLRSRRQMTIKASADGGRSWPEQHQLLLDEAPSAGYSCMSMIDDQSVGILYEGSQAHMTFQRVPLSEIVGE